MFGAVFLRKHNVSLKCRSQIGYEIKYRIKLPLGCHFSRIEIKLDFISCEKMTMHPRISYVDAEIVGVFTIRKHYCCLVRNRVWSSVFVVIDWIRG